MNGLNRHLTYMVLACGLLASTVFMACSSYKAMIEAPKRNLDPLPVGEVDPTGVAMTEEVGRAKQWYLDQINAQDGWDATEGTRRVTVAILSTGVDYNHPDLRDSILVNLKELKPNAPGDRDPRDGVDDDKNGLVDDIVGYDFVDEDGAAYDMEGHGTRAAGVIAAAHGNGIGTVGICRSVSILPVRYILAGQFTPLAYMAMALDYAASRNVDVVLVHAMSLTSDPSQPLRQVLLNAVREPLEKLANAGVPVVFSAGNRGHHFDSTNAFYSMVAGLPNTIVVTGSDENDHKTMLSNYGMELVHTAAPAKNIFTTDIGGGYISTQGTLMAAAQVAGAVALAISKHHGKIAVDGFRQALISENGGDPVAGMQLMTLGQNRLNIGKFLASFN